MLPAAASCLKEQEVVHLAAAHQSRRKILVVEDDGAMRLLVRDLLEEEGYTVASEPDTVSGFIRLVSSGADVMILDWKMPDLDGFKLLATVRRCYPDLPVIFVTAYATPDLCRRAIEAGAFSFLGKPFRRADLLAQIEDALK
jgi:CheY-like chemotaxis protein